MDFVGCVVLNKFRRCSKANETLLLTLLLMQCSFQTIMVPLFLFQIIDMFRGTISWKIKRSFYRYFGKINAQLPVELVMMTCFYQVSDFCEGEILHTNV